MVARAFSNVIFKQYFFSFINRGMYGADSKLKAFLCKEKDCEVRHYESEFRVVSLATFIQSLTLPQAVSFSSFKNIIEVFMFQILSFIGTFSVNISECILVE